MTPLARVVSTNDASPSDGDNKRLVCVRGDQCHDHIKDICTRLHFNDNWECFLFWNQNFCLQIKKYQEKLTVVYITENDSTVCYFNKVKYLFGMNNQLILVEDTRSQTL
jgi:hypothetical protein